MNVKSRNNDRDRWCSDDPAPDCDLSDIETVSLRAKAMLVRSTSNLVRSDFVQLNGAVVMLSGMDYHYRNFVKLIQSDNAQPRGCIEDLQHEAVAWVNRIGQFYYFSQSRFVNEHLPNIQTPRIDKILPFRMKHTAHRSIDSPKKEDSSYLQEFQALAFERHSRTLWVPRPSLSIDNIETATHLTHFLAFQIPLSDGSYAEFALERDHPELIMEGYEILRNLLRN
ncbi:hypothetical protein [Candidatus Methylobacter oryzae]|uniref:Uncharacterized protein n=1 Tax=Candidatus Methylobacter oryzae TaxID=2497749 RepID=A0ABY3C4T0_9GAMM|nr:hypothetical protein [Candidatus Methylobacter oryzae]TRW89741.1 hypothetical protein EKO24_022095 [Candidatus Methylobacter oryzae]